MNLFRASLVVAFILTSFAFPISNADETAALRLQPCDLNNIKGARCGKYEVFEDRESRAGRKIALNIIVLPAMTDKPAADPVFFLAGGPGQGAAAIVRNAGADYMQAIRRQRDVVFVDQRGTGESNPLNCNLFGDGSSLQPYFDELFPVEKVRECRARLEKISNPALYTTSIAMEDLDEVRRALGYDRINLWGGSYGTAASLAYLRRYPKQVRSVVLEGAASLDFKVPLPFAKGAQQALDRLMEDCAADETCRKAFPNLRAEFASVLAKLDKGPVSFEMKNPATKKLERVRMSRGVFGERLRLLLYSPDLASLVPFLIHEASKDNFVPLAQLGHFMTKLIGDQVAMGMYFSVTCPEDTLLITEQEIARETKGTFLGDYRVRAHVKACEQWPRGKVPSGFTSPVKSDVPVLIISGAVDPATPPQYGEAAARHLANGRQILVPNTPHSYGGRCIDSLVEEFITKATARGLDASCVNQIRRPPFATEMPDELSQ
ncbi:MAG TPA: alpha/beta fold hydrolase [Blastocatellia bacterium]|nr:alpha/beta fold hydrolase [Blastocatellia bacterium]